MATRQQILASMSKQLAAVKTQALAIQKTLTQMAASKPAPPPAAPKPIPGPILTPIIREPILKLKPPRRPVTTPEVTKITIPKGATLSGLAKQYGTTVPALMAVNPQIKDPNLIYAGAKLNISAAPPAKAPSIAAPEKEPDIELTRTLGVTVQAVRELIKKVEKLENK